MATTGRNSGRYEGALAQTARAFVFSPTGLAAGSTLLILVAVAIVGPLIWGGAATTLDVSAANETSSALHPLGTDAVGRDILARVLVATQLSLGLGLAGAVMGAVIGISIGAGIGLAGPRLAYIGRRLIDIWLTFPYLLVVILISVVAAGLGTLSALIAVGLASAPFMARLTSNLVSSIGGREFIMAGRAAGIPPSRLLVRHVLPNTAEPLCIVFFNLVSHAIIAFASLSFLGLGVQLPAYDWGSLLNQGLKDIYIAPLAALAPGVMIVITGMSAAFFGESLAHAMNPLVWTGARIRPSAQGSMRTVYNTSSSAARPAGDGASSNAVLEVRGLSVRIPVNGRQVNVVDDVTLSVQPGEIVGLVGESGAGKTMTLLAIAGLVPFPGTSHAEQLVLAGRDLMSAGRQRNAILAAGIGVVFQDPAASLNPALRIGIQLQEGVIRHRRISRRKAWALAVQRMSDMRIPKPETVMNQYPNELSGGMRQRVMIAMALMMEPALIVADEPTSSIDVTIQAHLLALFEEINRRRNTAILLISHDIALISSVCSRVIVMYAGRVVEEIDSASLTAGAAAHPYTRALVGAVPDLQRPRDQLLTDIAGQSPNVGDLPSGCPFHPRCPVATGRCIGERPALLALDEGSHQVACWVAHGLG